MSREREVDELAPDLDDPAWDGLADQQNVRVGGSFMNLPNVPLDGIATETLRDEVSDWRQRGAAHILVAIAWTQKGEERQIRGLERGKGDECAVDDFQAHRELPRRGVIKFFPVLLGVSAEGRRERLAFERQHKGVALA